MLDPEANELRKKNFTRPLTRPGHLEDALRSAGFSEVQTGETHIRTEFASFEDYWRPFDGKDGPIPSYLSKRPAELKKQINESPRVYWRVKLSKDEPHGTEKISPEVHG
jgi:hypothetical protein